MRAFISFLLVSLACTLLAGCTEAVAGYKTAPGVPPTDQLAQEAAAPLTESLFKEDEKVISNEDLQKILAAKITLSEHAKLAVVRAGRLPYWFGWSEDFTQMNRKTDAQFIEKMQSAPRIRQAVYLPTMAIPHELTIPYLRQAGARFQADMVLIYRTSSQTYGQQKMFATDQTRAYCTLEALLIDTRTGVIPFSTIVTEDFSAQRQKSDVNFNETVAKAEQQAIAKAQLEMADQVVRFLAGVKD